MTFMTVAVLLYLGVALFDFVRSGIYFFMTLKEQSNPDVVLLRKSLLEIQSRKHYRIITAIGVIMFGVGIIAQSFFWPITWYRNGNE
jgi:hypothetical protein